MPSKSSPQSHATLPFTLNTPEFLAAWEEYLEYRRQRRLPKLVPISVQKCWDKLSDFGPEVAVATINETLSNGWAGLFPERNNRERAGQLPGGGSPARASLGALQMQLKQVESRLDEIFYPGGAQWRVDPTPQKKAEAEKLMLQRKSLKLQIDKISCQ